MTRSAAASQPDAFPETVRSHTGPNHLHRTVTHGRATALTLAEAHWLVRKFTIVGLPLDLVRGAPAEAYEDLYQAAMQEEAVEIADRHRRAKIRDTFNK